MGKKKTFPRPVKGFKYAKSRRFSAGFPAFRQAFLQRFKEELKFHEGPTRADLEDIFTNMFHEYVESNLTLNEFLDKVARSPEARKKRFTKPKAKTRTFLKEHGIIPAETKPLEPRHYAFARKIQRR